MVIEDKIYIGDVGTLIEAETFMDLTGAVILRFEMITPDGNTVSWTAIPKNGAASIALHTVAAGELNQAGLWRGQVYSEWSESQKWHGSTFKFTVHELGR